MQITGVRNSQVSGDNLFEYVNCSFIDLPKEIYSKLLAANEQGKYLKAASDRAYYKSFRDFALSGAFGVLVTSLVHEIINKKSLESFWSVGWVFVGCSIGAMGFHQLAKQKTREIAGIFERLQSRSSSVI
ncbi:MAG: hypothetical protein RLZZ453_1077 [Chlamydiota bacterium]|jgi:hypothetical protein